MCDECPPFCTSCGDYGCYHTREEWEQRIHALRERIKALAKAGEAFREPMRRYQHHSTWLKGDENMLVEAWKAMEAALPADGKVGEWGKKVQPAGERAAIRGVVAPSGPVAGPSAGGVNPGDPGSNPGSPIMPDPQTQLLAAAWRENRVQQDRGTALARDVRVQELANRELVKLVDEAEARMAELHGPLVRAWELMERLDLHTSTPCDGPTSKVCCSACIVRSMCRDALDRGRRK